MKGRWASQPKATMTRPRPQGHQIRNTGPDTAFIQCTSSARRVSAANRSRKASERLLMCRLEKPPLNRSPFSGSLSFHRRMWSRRS
jgi:hypothetical protein